jgi:hypothetical protein
MHNLEMKNPDWNQGLNHGLKQGGLSGTSREIITRYPNKPLRPYNGKKLIQIDGQWFRASEVGQYYAKLAKEAQSAFHPVNGSFESIPEPKRLIAEPETSGHAPSLSLLRNNCTETESKTPPKPLPKGLNTHNKKTKRALQENVNYLVEKYGIENIGFLTLTFKQMVTSAKEAQRRYKSLNTHVLSQRYTATIRVMERCKSGRIHYHLLVVLDQDIRTGFDFSAIKNQDYSSANKAIRLEWAYWRKTAPLYGFGRTELLPIKSTGRALGQYIGKYIAKHIEHRIMADKGVRLVSYGGNSRNWNSKHTPLDYASTQWRYKLNTFARQVTKSKGVMCYGIADFQRHLGKNWAFKFRDYIMTLEPIHPTCPF